MAPTTVSAHRLTEHLGDWRVAGLPLYEALGRRIGRLLADGRLGAGAGLPSERALAAELAVSRTTATRAYAWLRDAGMLDSRQGSGSTTRLPGGASLTRVPWGVHPAGDLIDLTVATSRPPAELATALADVVAHDAPAVHGHGYHPLGLPALREAIAERYGARGLPTRPEQVMVTSGAQQALDLISRLLVQRGDLVLVESPTYPGIVDVARLAGARLASFDVVARGWDPERVSDLVQRAGARFLYLVADFHNPTGRTMSDEHRSELMSLLRRLPVTVIVDETMAELSLSDEPLPHPLAAPAGAASLISVGSLSKSVWAGLRVGWLRASESTVAALARLRASSDLGGPVLEQLLAVRLLTGLDAMLEARRPALRAQSSRMIARVRDELGWSIPVTPAGGLSAWAQLPQGSSTVLADVGPRFGVAITPGPRFSADGALDAFVRVPFSLPLDDLDRAVDRLALAQEATAGRRAAERPSVV